MKQVTFTAPMVQKKMVEVEQAAPVGRVILRVFETDARTFRTKVHIQVGLFDDEDNFIQCLPPVTYDELPDGWATTLDTLDGKILGTVKGTFSEEAKTGVPDGTVGTFDAVATAEAIAAAAAAKVVVEEPK